MSVYTTVTPDELDAWLTRYALGAFVDITPIAAGIENTNYFVTTERGRFVLTLYERLPSDELPFYLNLMAHLARCGVEVPAPAPDRTGALFSVLNGRPAGLVARIEGAPVPVPTHAACAAVGDALARMHVAAQGYRFRVPYGTLLCVSDKPLHGEIKLPGQANLFYEQAIAAHLQIGISACERLRAEGPRLHSRKLRAFNEPPFR